MGGEADDGGGWGGQPTALEEEDLLAGLEVEFGEEEGLDGGEGAVGGDVHPQGDVGGDGQDYQVEQIVGGGAG